MIWYSKVITANNGNHKNEVDMTRKSRIDALGAVHHIIFVVML